jgi:hypothetical protein
MQSGDKEEFSREELSQVSRCQPAGTMNLGADELN